MLLILKIETIEEKENNFKFWTYYFYILFIILSLIFS